MKRLIRISITVLTLVYVSCQREVDIDIPPVTPTPTDSTGTDSTIVNPPDLLAIISFSPDSGAIGSEVRIVGSGFDSITSGNNVLINTTAATVTSATNTILMVQIAEGSSTGKISVTANGKSVTSLKDFIVKKDSIITDTTANHTDVWTRKGDFPKEAALIGMTSIAVGNKGYFYNGFELWEYNPATDRWSKKATQPAGPYGFYTFAFSVDNKLYFGSNGSEVPDSVALWAYDIATNAWGQKQNLPIQPRIAAFAFAANNTGYVGGGQTGFDPDSMNAHDFWKYDSKKDTWSRQADFPGGWSIGISGFSISDEGYVYDAGLGFPQAPTNTYGQGRLWHYNDAANTWTEKATCPGGTESMSAVAFSIGSKGYVAVSRFDQHDSPLNNFWMYDPGTDAWTKKADIGGGIRWFGSGFAVGSKGYVGLGNSGFFDAVKNDFWEYTPD